MSARLKSRCNHDIDASLFQRNRFVWRGGRSERNDPSLGCLIQYFFRRNAVDKREGGNAGIEKHARLILKPDWLVRCKFRLRAAERFDVWRQMRQSAAECCSVQRVGFRIFHRDPQVHRKWLRRQRTNLGDHIFNRVWFETVRAE